PSGAVWAKTGRAANSNTRTKTAFLMMLSSLALSWASQTTGPFYTVKAAGRTTGLRRPALEEWPRLRGEGDDPEGAAGAADDFERRSDDHSASRRQLIEIAKAGKAKLSAAVHDEMV